MNNTDQIKDGFLYLAIFLGLIVMSIFIPLVILPAIVLFPLPFLLFAYKYNWQKALVFSLISVLVSFILFGDLGLLISVLAIATGVLIGAALNSKVSPYEAWSRGALGGIIGFLFIFVYVQIIFEVNWEVEIIEFTKESIALSKDMFKNIGIGAMNAEQVKVVEAQMLAFTRLIPAFILLTGVFYGFIVQWLGHVTINRVHKVKLSFPPFRELRFPVLIIWVYLLALIATLLQSENGGTIITIADNIIVIVGALLLIQGFAFLFYLGHKKKIPRFLPVLAIVLTVIFPFFFMFIIRLLGIVDIGFDMRKYLSDKKE